MLYLYRVLLGRLGNHLNDCLFHLLYIKKWVIAIPFLLDCLKKIYTKIPAYILTGTEKITFLSYKLL